MAVRMRNGDDLHTHLAIGAITFPNMDQCDLTGPFEVLSRLPDSTFHVVGKRKEPIRDSQYAPEPPFDSGSPEEARTDTLEAARRTSSRISEARLATAKRLSAKLGIQ